MKTLLEFYLQYLDFIYLDPEYRITNSKTTGSATINASLTLTGPTLTWQIANDRGQIQFAVSPTGMSSPENWFRAPIVRQYLDGHDEEKVISPAETVAWIRDNVGRIKDLFADSSVVHSCEKLAALEEGNALKYWGPDMG